MDLKNFKGRIKEKAPQILQHVIKFPDSLQRTLLKNEWETTVQGEPFRAPEGTDELRVGFLQSPGRAFLPFLDLLLYCTRPECFEAAEWSRNCTQSQSPLSEVGLSLRKQSAIPLCLRQAVGCWLDSAQKDNTTLANCIQHYIGLKYFVS